MLLKYLGRISQKKFMVVRARHTNKERVDIMKKRQFLEVFFVPGLQ